MDNNNCLLSLFDTIEQPTSPILIEDSVVDVNCANASNGSIVLDVSGGTPPFIYVWSSGQSTPSINQLSPSLYSVLILDDNGCTANYSTIVGSTDPISSMFIKKPRKKLFIIISRPINAPNPIIILLSPPPH